jgi:hypothetical protein
MSLRKKGALVVGAILVAAALVAIGWSFGASQRVLKQLFTTTVVDKQISEAVTTSLLLNNIDSGALDDARSMLKIQLDGNILFIDLLLPDCDECTRDLAQKVFTRIG